MLLSSSCCILKVGCWLQFLLLIWLMKQVYISPRVLLAFRSDTVDLGQNIKECHIQHRQSNRWLFDKCEEDSPHVLLSEYSAVTLIHDVHCVRMLQHICNDVWCVCVCVCVLVELTEFIGKQVGHSRQRHVTKQNTQHRNTLLSMNMSAAWTLSY